MEIKRKRFIITTENRSKIFCGLARNFELKDINNIGDTAIKTYLSEKKALSAFRSSYKGYEKPIEIVEVIESIVF